jgi:uncharacterized protein (DUF58 family)
VLTRHGWLLAIAAGAMLVAGRVLGAPELFVLGAVAAALVLGCALYTGLARLSVDVDRELHPTRVHAGTPSRVELVVENLARRRSPVVELADSVSGTRGVALGVGPLEPGATTRVAYQLPTEQRGILTVGPLRVVFGDPFGLTRLILTAQGASELTVYPHVDRIAPVPRTTGSDPLGGISHPDALGRGGEDFYALRPYVVGDDLRRVHWPSSARHDDLMVRQDELPWQGRTTVLVDLRARRTPPAALEAVVSAAASVVAACDRNQDLVRLVTSSGSDAGMGAGRAHVEAILEHLAVVGATGDAAWGPVLERLARADGGGALVALVAEATAEDLAALGRLGRRYGRVLIVQVRRSAWDPTTGSPERDGAVPPPPGTVVVDAAHPFPEAWDAMAATLDPRRSDRARERFRRARAAGSGDPPDDDLWSAHERILR